MFGFLNSVVGSLKNVVSNIKNVATGLFNGLKKLGSRIARLPKDIAMLPLKLLFGKPIPSGGGGGPKPGEEAPEEGQVPPQQQAQEQEEEVEAETPGISSVPVEEFEAPPLKAPEHKPATPSPEDLGIRAEIASQSLEGVNKANVTNAVRELDVRDVKQALGTTQPKNDVTAMKPSPGQMKLGL